jgi:hypothetical protein
VSENRFYDRENSGPREGHERYRISLKGVQGGFDRTTTGASRTASNASSDQ